MDVYQSQKIPIKSNWILSVSLQYHIMFFLEINVRAVCSELQRIILADHELPIAFADHKLVDH